MDARRESEPIAGAMKNQTTVEQKSDRELVARRTFDGPARIVFEAWTTPELLERWWVPKSMGMSLVSCEADVRVGGKYRFEFLHPQFPGPVAFFGTYLEVTPPSRLKWTNEESEDGAVTTVTFTEEGGKTHLVLSEVYPSKEALERSAGAMEATPEQFEQLDALLLALGAGA